PKNLPYLKPSLCSHFLQTKPYLALSILFNLRKAMASTATTATASSLIIPNTKPLSFTSIAKPTSVFFAIPSSSSPLKLSCLQLPFPQLSSSSSFSSRFVRRVSVSSDFDQEDGLMVDEDGDDDSEDGPAGFSPPPSLKLYVGNLPFSVDSAQLAGIFETAGNVEMVEVVYDKISGRSRGFAFVTMSTVEEAEAATQQFNGYELDGRALRVNAAGNPPPRDSSSPFARGGRVGGGGGGGGDENRLYVGNLSWGVDNSALEALFSEHGNVVDARVVYDKESGRSRGFGFVSFSSADDMNNALDSLDGADLDGRSIRVSVAESRPRRF
ncbi:31 kDa ribonucleoprotein, chloroplastic, partial [Linum grandiflorum]